jgi:hypothetical protein
MFLGILFALPAFLLAVASAGAGHGHYVMARMLFPFSMLLTLVEGSIGPIALAVALFQFPLYGAMVGWAVSLKTFRPTGAIFSIHLIAIIACFSGIIPMFS